VPEVGGGTIVRPARYVSVTTALGVVDKPALVFWAGNLAARRAMDNLPKLIVSTRTESCGRARARTEPLGCGTCCDCVEFWVAMFHHGEKERRAREGSAAHDVFERWILRGDWVYEPRADWGEYAPTPDEMAPYIASLKQFVADYALTGDDFLAAECTVYHHGLKYAGTLDAVVTIRPRTKKAADFCARVARFAGIDVTDPLFVKEGVRVLLDLKSREGEDAAIYAEYVLQLAGYRFAETAMPKLAGPEMERPMWATDAAAILQVRPDDYTLRPVLADGRAMKAFRAVLDLADWKSTLGDYSTQVQAFPRPDGWKAPTWERATLPHMEGRATGLCPCPYCDDPSDSRCTFGGHRPLGKHTKEVDADGQPVKPPPRKRAAKKATAPEVGKVTVVDREDGAALFYPPAELLAGMPEPAPVKATKRASKAAPAASATMESLRNMRPAGAKILDSDIPY
jgi:hypothetical protein